MLIYTSAEMRMRCQYVFIENGSPFELTEAHLGESLGRLEYDILAGRETNSARDYAATFAVGGDHLPDDGV